jgi:hypothetical protein
MLAGLQAGPGRGHSLDRLDDDALGMRILNDIDADAAEIAALERLFEFVDLGRRQVRRVGIAERAEHAAHGSLRDLAGQRPGAVVLLRDPQRAIERVDVLFAAARGERDRDLRFHHMPAFQQLDDLVALAVEHRLRVHRTIVCIFNLGKRRVEQPLVRRPAGHQQRLEGAGSKPALGDRPARHPLVDEIQRAAERRDGDEKESGKGAGCWLHGSVVFKRKPGYFRLHPR